MGITRSNVMAGLAGAWLITGDDEAVLAASLPSGKFVVPLIIQDRAFGADGQLLFQGHSAWQMEWYGAFRPRRCFRLQPGSFLASV